MQIQIVENVLDFFITNKIHSNNSGASDFVCRYSKLKKLLAQFESNEVIYDSIVYALYFNIKKESIPFKTLIDAKDVLTFWDNYTPYISEYEVKHKDFVQKLMSFVFIDNSFVKKPEELVPYLIVEALLELSYARSSFLPKTNGIFKNDSMMLHDEFLKIENYNKIVEEMSNKPLGYYLSEDFPQIHVNFLKSKGYMMIVNKSDGIYIHQMNNEISNFGGFRGMSLQFENIISKKHNIEIELNESNQTTLSTFIKHDGFSFNSFINRLVLNTFIYLSTMEEEKIKTNNPVAIGYQKLENTENQYPVVADYKSFQMPVFSKEELRFDNEFSFLSFLDEWLEPYLEMDYVNFYSDDIQTFFEVTFDHHKPFHKYEATKESLNSFKVKAVKENIDERSNNSLTPINPYFFGSEKEMYDYAFKIAKANKLKLYSLYLSNLKSIYEYQFSKELHSFFMKNITTLMEDDNFIGMINSVGSGNISNRNREYLTQGFYSSPSIIIHDAFIDMASDFNDEDKENEVIFSKHSFDTFGFKDFIKKTKANKMIVTHCDNMTMLDYLRTNYGFILGDEYEKFIKVTKAYKELAVLKKQNVPDNIRLHNLSVLHDSPFEAEYYNGWLINFIPFSIAIPMSNKNEKVFMEKFMVNNIKITNCNFGYTNNSTKYYINPTQYL